MKSIATDCQFQEKMFLYRDTCTTCAYSLCVSTSTTTFSAATRQSVTEVKFYIFNGIFVYYSEQ